MRINIISVGKKNEGAIGELVSDYQKRIEKYFSVEWIFIKHSDKKEESNEILGKIKDEDFLILLDERGKALDNMELKNNFEKVMISGKKRVVFVIGGAYGVSDEVFNRTNLVLSLSKLVFPHLLARVILIEQIYRTISLIKGEKYHHS